MSQESKKFCPFMKMALIIARGNSGEAFPAELPPEVFCSEECNFHVIATRKNEEYGGAHYTCAFKSSAMHLADIATGIGNLGALK